MAISSEEILDMPKKDFVHLGLNKKETKESQVGLNGFIKVVGIVFHFLILPISAYWLLNLNRANETKANKKATPFG